MTISQAKKIAILINGTSIHTEGPTGIKASFTSAITSVLPTAQIDFYDPIHAQSYPAPQTYDLIVLSGGTADPMSSEPWILKMQTFLRTTVRDYPRQKILGICWGHQTIAAAFGGSVVPLEKAELGITKTPLTLAGSSFLSRQGSAPHIRLHEFHKREVQRPGKGFIALAEDKQAFVNAENTVLTFQGHPEMTAELARKLLGAAPGYMGVGAAQMEEVAGRLEGGDGGLVWGRVLEWVDE